MKAYLSLVTDIVLRCVDVKCTFQHIRSWQRWRRLGGSRCACFCASKRKREPDSEKRWHQRSDLPAARCLLRLSGSLDNCLLLQICVSCKGNNGRDERTGPVHVSSQNMMRSWLINKKLNKQRQSSCSAHTRAHKQSALLPSLCAL